MKMNLDNTIKNMTSSELADMVSGGSIVHIPEGIYPAVAIEFEERETKSGDIAVVITVVITDGEHEGTELSEWFNFNHSTSDGARRIAYGKYGQLCEACGLEHPAEDTDELTNVPIMIQIKNKKSNDWKDDEGNTVEGKMQSSIKAYLPNNNKPSKRSTTSAKETKKGGEPIKKSRPWD